MHTDKKETQQHTRKREHTWRKGCEQTVRYVRTKRLRTSTIVTVTGNVWNLAGAEKKLSGNVSATKKDGEHVEAQTAVSSVEGQRQWWHAMRACLRNASTGIKLECTKLITISRGVRS